MSDDEVVDAEIVPVGEVKILADRSPVERLADQIAAAHDTLTDHRSHASPLAVAALLVAGGVIVPGTWPMTGPVWVSTVEPGDTVDGQIVIRAQVRVSVREGARPTELTLATPLVRGATVDDVVWVDQRVVSYPDPYEQVTVTRAVWPTRW